MAAIRLEAIEKAWPDGSAALRGVDLEVGEGEFLVLVGPSGCGKSTALRIVAGLETPTAGRVWIGGRDVSGAAPGERDVAMVFQSYALYPHKSVAENLAFGLRMRGVAPDERERRVREVAARLGLDAVLERRPAELSGGQRQRVALGRALARCRQGTREAGQAGRAEGAGAGDGPAALLLDEPLSNLDAGLRLETRAELARLHRELGVTMLYVTHDQEEAMTLGDRIAVLRDGRIEQVAAPLEVYRHPATPFVADFVGVPRMNWFQGRVEGEGATRAVVCEGLRVELPSPDAELDAPLLAPELDAPLAVEPGREVRLGIRPHDLALEEPGRADLRGSADVVEALGSSLVVHARSEAGIPFRVLVPAETKLTVGDRLAVRLRTERLHLFDAGSGQRL